ncbi:MAG: ABC transporter substrate-binding protein [Alphaproteobacteria bacterium]|nr:ABC transporter substrate-binding protein [Alphaproteobacteria bacterium]
MRHLIALIVSAVLVLSSLALPALAADGTVSHGFAIHGQPGYPADFKHFSYVDPAAPRGGEVVLSAPRTFDSLHPFILKGVAAAGLGLLYESLMVGAADEASTVYGLIAKSIETPADRSWAIFELRPEARFHDGKPITADDVVFTHQILTTKGHPQYKSIYADIAGVEKLGTHKVKFAFKGANNREMPQIAGGMTVLPKNYWEGREFDKTTLEPPLGSGPYKITNVDPGRAIAYERVKDHWADKVPAMVGRYNFGTIRFEYYRDATVEVEAFKSGAFDFRQEYTARDWATSYDFPALRQGLVKKEELANNNPARMQGFLFNQRRDIFKDRRVREALGFAFDFEWSNKTLFYGQYVRVSSYFSNSELAATGLPGPEELKILEPFRGRLPDEVFTKIYQPPVYDGSGNIRDGLRKALALLKEAGWNVNKEGKLVNAQGKPFEFEILYQQPGLERMAQPFARNLERLGIVCKLRLIDTSQYQNRMDNFDFDMVIGGVGQSLSPGNEQRLYWTSAEADKIGSDNIGGIKDKAIDELVELVVAAPDRESLIQRTRALDRVLLWGFYLVPQYNAPTYRVIHWDKFGKPAKPPKYALGFTDTWWVDPAKAAQLVLKKKAL